MRLLPPEFSQLRLYLKICMHRPITVLIGGLLCPHENSHQKGNEPMVIQRTNVGQLALCASLIASLVACSHSPSEGDAKEAVEAHYAGCAYFLVTKLDTMTSIPTDNNHYRVDVKYTIRMFPDGAMKDFAEQYNDDYHRYRLLRAEADRKMDTYLNNKQTYIDANKATDINADQTFESQHEAQHREVTDAQIEVSNLGKRLSFDTPTRFFRLRIESACPTVNLAILPSFLSGKAASEFEDHVDAEFTETLAMMKTDNGWQEGRKQTTARPDRALGRKNTT